MHHIKVLYIKIRLYIYSILLFVSIFLWMALPYNSGPDMTIQKGVGATSMLMQDNRKPTSDEILFIDVSKSKYLVPLNADSTENDVITNRKYLAQLFIRLANAKGQIKYVLCDVHFDIPTPDDSLLVQSISQLGNKFLGINVYANDSLYRNLASVRSATASVYLQQNAVYKIPYFGAYGDTLVPFKMYADMDKIDVKERFLFTNFQGKGIAFNNQINDYLLRRSDFTNGEYVKVGLGELVSILELSPEVFDYYLKNRYILIGDFENDVHNTYLNAQPGTLILFNAYLHMHLGRQILPIWYLAILYVFLHWIVWLQTGRRKRHLKLVLRIKYFEPFELSVNILSISLLLVIFTFLSSLLFNINISIFHLIVIFSFVDLAQFIWNKRIKKKTSPA